MRAAAILGPGSSQKMLRFFQEDKTIEWLIGMPAAADQADVILLFGGDGTVHRYLGQLVRLRVPVLVVPVGSGNDFARAIGLRKLRDSLAAWRKFRQQPVNVSSVDLGIVAALPDVRGQETPVSAPENNKRYFACVAGVGLDSDVARRANRLPRWLRAHGGYVLCLASAIFGFAPLPVEVLIASAQTDDDGHGEKDTTWRSRSNQPTILAAFANTPTYGGGMKVAPKAKMDDGLLDICVVGGLDPFKLFCMFPTVYSGRHLQIREVEYFQARRLRVVTETPLDVYADGEYVCHTPVEVTVATAALRVVIP